jgi:hypothetical protein
MVIDDNIHFDWCVEDEQREISDPYTAAQTQFDTLCTFVTVNVT